MAGTNERVGGIEAEASIDTSKFDASTQKLNDSLNKLDPSLKRTEQSMNKVEEAGRRAGHSAENAGLSFKKLFPSLTAANLAADGIRRTLTAVKDAFHASKERARAGNLAKWITPRAACAPSTAARGMSG